MKFGKNLSTRLNLSILHILLFKYLEIMIRKRIQRILIFNLLLEICFFSICFSDVVEQVNPYKCKV